MPIQNKIMILSNKIKQAQRLKEELESRIEILFTSGGSIVVDIHNANPKKLLEELIIKKGLEESDYRIFLIDIPDAYEFAENLKHNFPDAHLVLLSYRGRPKTTNDMRSNSFAYHYKPGMSMKECERLWRKNHHPHIKDGEELSDDRKSEKAEFERAIKAEQLGFDHNYIKTPIRNYGYVASKLNHILVAGVYQRGVKYYPSPKEERKAKDKKAFEEITGGLYSKIGHGNNTIYRPLRPVNDSDVVSKLAYYGQDITEPKHAAAILKHIRAYAEQKRQELKSVEKLLRDWEDRFPSVVEDPSTFEVAQQQEGDETKKK